eukprot:14859-Heterococcus_DN1.PRE.1
MTHTTIAAGGVLSTFAVLLPMKRADAINVLNEELARHFFCAQSTRCSDLKDEHFRALDAESYGPEVFS